MSVTQSDNKRNRTKNTFRQVAAVAAAAAFELASGRCERKSQIPRHGGFFSSGVRTLKTPIRRQFASLLLRFVVLALQLVVQQIHCKWKNGVCCKMTQ